MAAKQEAPRAAHRVEVLALVLGMLLAPSVLGQVAPEAAAQRLAPPPSLVLLTLDTTRSDALGAYGAAGARTPVLDALAAVSLVQTP